MQADEEKSVPVDTLTAPKPAMRSIGELTSPSAPCLVVNGTL